MIYIPYLKDPAVFYVYHDTAYIVLVVNRTGEIVEQESTRSELVDPLHEAEAKRVAAKLAARYNIHSERIFMDERAFLWGDTV